LVTFEERNLIDEDALFWRAEAFDAVFCRNVLMYLTHDAMRAVAARVARSLRSGGFLFLGHAETLRGISQDFHLRHTHDTFYYQRRSDSTAVETPEVVVLSPVPAWPHEPTVSLSAALGLDDLSWMEAIARASERVATLTERTPEQRREPSTTETPRIKLPRPTVDRSALLQMMREERFAEALGVLRSLPASSQTDPEALLLRAVLLTNAGNLGEAENACKQLLAIDELSAGAHYLTALCREHAGNRAVAIDHDRTAAYLEPEFAMPRLHLGLLERRAGNLAKARVELDHALALLPGEDASRILLFGGGFGRGALMDLCRSERRRCGGAR
jgi:chemotaxis protein methyltransferase CheR